MSDYRTEQSAAALWREIDARIDRKLGEHRKRQSGITPDVAYGSVMFNAAGEAVWGGAGGGNSAVTVRYHINNGGAGQSFSGGTQTRINFDNSVFRNPPGGLDNPVTVGASWVYTAALSGIYRVTAALSIDLSTYSISGVMSLKLLNGGSYPSGLQNVVWPGSASENGILDGMDAGYAKPILHGSDEVLLEATETLYCELYTSDNVTIKSGYIVVSRVGTV